MNANRCSLLFVIVCIIALLCIDLGCERKKPTENETDIPEKPTLVVPDTSGTSNYVIWWTKSAKATSYMLQEDVDPGFSAPRNAYFGADTTTRMTSKSFGKIYWYRVRANNNSGSSDWSETQSIVVEQKPTPRIAISPTTLDFGEVYADSFRDLQIRISNNGSAVLVVQSISSTNSKFSIIDSSTFSVLINSSRAIKIRFSPVGVLDIDSGFIDIKSNFIDDYTPRISLKGRGIADSPRISCNLTDLNFGDVAPGYSKDSFITIKNLGNLPLNVTNISSNNSVFTMMGSTNFIIPISDSHQVTIKFSPMEFGLENGTLSILSNDFERSPFSISMSGIGTTVIDWTTKASMPTATAYFGVGVVNGRIYAVGGAGGDGIVSNLLEYDPITNSWSNKTPMLTPRQGLAVCAVDNKIYAIGGWSNYMWLSTVEVYDPITDTWATKTPMPTARGNLSVGVVNGKIYAIGGENNARLTTVEEYDPVADTWKSMASMPTARTELAAGVSDNVIYAIGGHNANFGGNLGIVEAYDPTSDTWTPKASMPTKRRELAVCTVNGRIYAIGGYDDTVLFAVEEYDPTYNIWSDKTRLPTARRGLGIGVVAKKIYCIGGGPDTGLLPTNEEGILRP